MDTLRWRWRLRSPIRAPSSPGPLPAGGGSTRRPQRCSGWLVILGALSGFVLGEVLLVALDLPRWYRAHSTPDQFRSFVAPDGRTTYANLPSADIVFAYDGNPRGYFGPGNTVHHRTNSWGFRGQEFGPKKPGSMRLAFLGDSFTFGEGVKDEDVFANVVPRLLTERQRPQGRAFEGYNFGVGGYNTRQEIELLKNTVVWLDPDVIILVFVLNDAEPDLFVLNPASGALDRQGRSSFIPEELSESRPPASVFYRLRSAQLIWQTTRRKRLAAQAIDYYATLYREDAPGWTVARENLLSFVETCQKLRKKGLVVVFPLLFQLDSRYPFRELHERVKRVVEEQAVADVAFLDLLPYFLSRNERSLWVHPVDQHPNERAHRIAAEAMAPVIETLSATVHRDTASIGECRAPLAPVL